jgi:hypothetical protein
MMEQFFQTKIRTNIVVVKTSTFILLKKENNTFISVFFFLDSRSFQLDATISLSACFSWAGSVFGPTSIANKGLGRS